MLGRRLATTRVSLFPRVSIQNHVNRQISSLNKSTLQKISLDRPSFPLRLENPKVDGSLVPQISKLKSGLRVVSFSPNFPVSIIGIHMDDGIRNETAETAGINYFLDGLFYKSTQKIPELSLHRLLSQNAISMISQREREYSSVQTESTNELAPVAFELLTDSLFRPSLVQHEIDENTKNLTKALEMRNATMNDDKATDVVMEELLAQAYGRKGVGRPFPPSADVLHKFKKQHIIKHIEESYTPSRLIVAAVGIPHDSLVELSEKYLGELPEDKKIERAKSQYIGGESRINIEHTESFHVGLGFEGVSQCHKDYAATMILHFVLGGGLSFSQGGPGKGMLSRLYSRVMGHQDFESATSTVEGFTDSSLFILYGRSPRTHANALVDSLLSEARHMTEIEPWELKRAKNLLKYNLYSVEETKIPLVDDAAKQLLGTNKYQSLQEWIDIIDQTTEKDITRVASNLLKSKLTIVYTGHDTVDLSTYDELCARLK